MFGMFDAVFFQTMDVFPNQFRLTGGAG